MYFSSLYHHVDCVAKEYQAMAASIAAKQGNVGINSKEKDILAEHSTGGGGGAGPGPRKRQLGSKARLIQHCDYSSCYI